MTQKVKYLLIGAGIVIFVGLGILIGWNVKPTITCPDVDTLYVKGNPYPVYRDTTIYISYPVEPAHTDEQGIKRAVFDTTVISGKDEIFVETLVRYNPADDIFSLVNMIEHKDVETIRIDTLKIKVTEVKYVDNPFYDSFEVGFSVGILLSIVLILLFGV